jgi:peptidoglycan/LPS O-acetylase OafA/YrhL
VLLVALDHAGVGFLKGGYVGVDVFFVLSGYLITGVLVSAADRARGRQYFFEFYARRARRILPAAALTLIVTDLAASSLLNLERAHQVLVDSIYSTFFVANIHFASVGTNYFATGQPPSPLQHFWSLSVEEQFYLVWPLVVALALLGITLRGRRRGRGQARSRRGFRALGIAAAAITVASLAYAVYDTHHSATAAYFSSPARAWELGLGAVLALSARRLARLPSAVLTLLGWVGIAAILAASTLYSPSTLFPGLPALLPAIGAAAVIAAGLRVDRSARAPSRILSMRPFRYVGDRSYTFYLWHWPVLVLVAEHVGHSLPVTTNLLLLLGAFALSIVTYALFENPIRRTPKLRGSAALALWPAAIMAVLFVSSIHWADYQNEVNWTYAPAPPEILKEAHETSLAASVEPAHAIWRPPASPPAVVAAVAAVRDSHRLPSPLLPSALSLASSVYKVPGKCVTEKTGTSSSICSLGDTTSKKSLVVFGDSHAQMWMPTILSYAQREGYDVRPIIKIGCVAPQWAGPDRKSECASWYKQGVAQVRALHPSLVIVTSHYNLVPFEGSVEETGPNATENISAFGAAVRSSAHRIVVLGDPPGQEQEPTDCLLSAHATMKRCSYTELHGQAEVTTGVESATKAFGVFLDTTPWFCYQGECPMVVGHTVVYFDRSHMTQRYSEELDPLFSSALTRLLVGGAKGHAAPSHPAGSAPHQTSLRKAASTAPAGPRASSARSHR